MLSPESILSTPLLSWFMIVACSVAGLWGVGAAIHLVWSGLKEGPDLGWGATLPFCLFFLFCGIFLLGTAVYATNILLTG
jgi:hypothetical protein